MVQQKLTGPHVARGPRVGHSWSTYITAF